MESSIDEQPHQTLLIQLLLETDSRNQSDASLMQIHYSQPGDLAAEHFIVPPPSGHINKTPPGVFYDTERNFWSVNAG